MNSPAIGNNGDLSGGHLNPSHQGPVFPAPNWGDIIPPYPYVDANGQLKTFPGYNWTAEGQVIYNSDPRCKPPPKPTPDPDPVVTPLAGCVELLAAGRFLAHFGYDNANGRAGSGAAGRERIHAWRQGQGAADTVQGRARGGRDIQVESTDGGELIWHLTGKEAKASLASPRCEGSITINKTPEPGR